MVYLSEDGYLPSNNYPEERITEIYNTWEYLVKI